MGQPLRSLRHLYTPEATAAKRSLLRDLARPAARRTPRSLAALVRLHEDLLFLRAFPDDAEVHALAGHALQGIAAAFRRLPRALRARADDSGIDGSSSRDAFGYPIVRWLVRRHPGEVEIDWGNPGVSAPLDALLHSLVVRVEEDALDSGEFSTREWLAAARGGRYPSTLAWLLEAGAPGPRSSRVFSAAFDAAEVPIRWRLAGSPGSVTRNELAVGDPVFRRGLRAAPASPRRHIAAPLRNIRLLGRREAAAVIDVARAALTARCRNVFAISRANPDDVWLADLGEGAALAIVGAAPGERMSVETNTGYMLFSNGVPIGYGGVTPLFHQANTGLNIFDPFRRSEAAFLWAQMLRAFHSLYGVTRFVVNAYQIGERNSEAIRSGAFWFYYRLGFRPVDPATRSLAATEDRRLRRHRGSRSPAATLGRLAAFDVHLTLPGFPAGAFIDEAWLADAGLRVTRLLSSEGVASRQAAARGVVRRVARALGADPASWPSGERTAFDQLAPLVALLPKIDRWPRTDHAALVALMRAKGHAQERDFVRQAQAHPRFFSELIALLGNGHRAT